MGSAAVLELAARGRRVLGLDRFGPAHALGSSHGGSRIIRQSYLEDPAYVPLLLRAWDRWHRLAADSGTDLFVTDRRPVRRPVRRTDLRRRRCARPSSGTCRTRCSTPPAWPPVPYVPAGTGEAGPVRGSGPGTRARRRRWPRSSGWRARPAPSCGSTSRSRPGRPARRPGSAPRPARTRPTRWCLTPAPGRRAAAGLDLPMVVERQVMHWFAPAGPIDAVRAEPGLHLR